MYRLIMESLLGLRLQTDTAGASLSISPCLPAEWTMYQIDYRFRETTYRINIALSDDEGEWPSIEVDGRSQPGPTIALLDDGGTHHVTVRVEHSRPRSG